MIKCVNCGKEQAETEFYRNRGHLHKWCKSCQRARAKTPEYKEKAKWRHLKKTYGLSEEQVHRMMQANASNCGICKTPIHIDCGRDSARAVVDHCHKTGQVRGLLCGPCNKALGIFGDSIDGLTQAINYLKEFENDSERRSQGSPQASGPHLSA